VLSLPCKMRKTSCEGAMKRSRVWFITNRPYLPGQLAKLPRQLTVSSVTLRQERIDQQGHVTEKLYGRVEIARVAQVR